MDTLKKIPNATSGTGIIECHTLNVGVVSANITINAPSSVTPSFTSLDITGNNLQWSKYVQWFSTATLTISGASGTYGSTITSYRITGSNIDAYAKQGTTGSLSNYGTLTYTATITDSRGRTASQQKSISVNQYYDPAFNWTKAYRSNSSGTADAAAGTYIYTSANWYFASVGGSNSATCWASVRELPSGTFGTESQITSNGGNKIFGSAYGLAKEYEVRIRVTDGLSKSSYSYIKIPTSACTVGYKAGGLGVSIGKSPTQNGFEVDWDSQFNKKVELLNGFYVTNCSSGSGSNGYIKFATLTFTSNYQNQPLQFTVVQRSRVGTFNIQFNNSGSTDHSLVSLTRLDGNILVYANKTATTTWDLWIQKSEGYDNITIMDLQQGNYSKITIDWKDEYASAVPSGATGCSNSYGNFSGISIDGNNAWHTGNCVAWAGTNQQCFRFENGLQIVRQWKSLGSVTLSNAWGSLYTQGGAQTGLDNYNWGFSSAPQVIMQAEGGGGTCFVLRSQSATSSWPGSYELARGASGTCPAVVMHVISIGQWK